MEVVLDTNFILTCLKEKIDFLRAGEYGQLILPLQVIDELRKKTEKSKRREREVAKLALDIIQKNRSNFKIIELEKKFVDVGIKKYVSGKKGNVIVATLDKELKKEIKDKANILVIRARKKFELV